MRTAFQLHHRQQRATRLGGESGGGRRSVTRPKMESAATSLGQTHVACVRQRTLFDRVEERDELIDGRSGRGKLHAGQAP